MLLTYCGYIAIIGRPNVGKSTLLNALSGKKLSITSRKPQTTRHKILGIKTQHNKQFIFVDTPGIHSVRIAQTSKLLNEKLNHTALSVLKDVDIIVWIIEASGLTGEDELVLERLKKILSYSSVPLFIGLNKIDVLKNHNDILAFIEQLSILFPTAEFIPLSATKNININKLENIIGKKLPEGPFFFDKTACTDRSEEFMAAEIIREKLVRFLGQELPYATAVSLQSIQAGKTREQKDILHINAVIWVEKEGQKKIVIGEKGNRLKLIGQKARLSMEKYFEKKVFLQLWVKVKSGWSENETLLQKILQ